MSSFRETISKIALAAALGTVISGNIVYAQTIETVDDEDEVIVTGVRASLERSLDVKRDAKSIVDSINAEELGRFPDNNVADSLSHIPGITVSRTRNGEADYVSIRGLGPEFSTTTLNNRILATDDDGRNFAFDVLPSEVITGADVWKTSEAKRVEGSIGGAINLRSARPFDDPGFHGTVSITGDHNSLSGEIGTKLTGVISNTFANDTLGIIVGLTQDKGTERADEMFDNYYFGVDDGIEYDVDGNGTIESDEQNLVAPGSYALGSYATEFERTGFTGAIQWRPNDRLEITADALVTRLEADSVGYTESFYMVDESDAQDRWSNIVLDGNVITAMDISDLTMEVVTLNGHRTVDTTMFGLNGDFEATDNLTFKGDLYVSESKRPSGGKNTFIVAGSPGEHSGRYELNEGGLPNFYTNWTEDRTSDDFGDSDFAPHWSSQEGSDIEDSVTGLTLEGEYEFNDKIIKSIDFGIGLTDRNKTRLSYDNYATACIYCGYPYTFDDVGATVVRDFPYDNLFEGVSGDIPRSFPIFDLDSYIAALAAADGQTFTNAAGVTTTFDADASEQWQPVYNPVNSYDITEEVRSFYTQANFEGSDWFANAGVRYIETDVTAEYSYNEILSIQIVDANSSNPSWDVEYSDSSDQVAEGSYKKLLPSVNFGKYLEDNLLLRVAAAQTMSRPTLEQLAPLTTDNAQSGLFTMEISGNPDIEPVFSDQLDASLEWYFADDSVFQVSVFGKNLDGFITGNTETVEIAGETFRVSQPINGDTATVRGFELALQKFFDNGFGVTGSYAHTKSDTVIDGVDSGPLTGVAEDSYSVSLIYEKDKISSQISLDYTSDIVDDYYSILGEGTNSITESSTQVSASLSYNIMEGGQVFLEGYNLLNEGYATYQGRSDIPGSLGIYGRTINFGARYVFK